MRCQSAQAPPRRLATSHFEIAQGDVREHLDNLAVFDEAWALRVLHNIASGINQLHQADVFHQDVKPSNVLLVEGGSKLGDLGRSFDKSLPSPHRDNLIPGDTNYVPPECIYAFFGLDRTMHSKAMDLYHLGSMVMFMFTKVSMTASIASHLDPQFMPPEWGGTFDEVLPHLRDAFDASISDLEIDLPDWLKSEIPQLVRQLCDPDPRLRGNAKRPVGSGARLSAEFFVSRFDFLAQKAEIELRRAMR